MLHLLWSPGYLSATFCLLPDPRTWLCGIQGSEPISMLQSAADAMKKHPGPSLQDCLSQRAVCLFILTISTFIISLKNL